MQLFFKKNAKRESELPQTSSQTSGDAGDGYRQMEDRDKKYFDGVKGTVQPYKYKDLSFAFLFLAHVLAILYLFVTADISQYGGWGNPYSLLAYFATYCAISATVFSVVVLIFMIKRPDRWIKTALAIALNIFLASGIMALAMGETIICAVSLTLFFLCGAYSVYMWKRIPYITVNFSTAIKVVSLNHGLFLAASMLMLLALVWSIVWIIASTGARDSVGAGILVVFLMSYFWVQQVLKNIMHVTAAGVVGCWCRTPEGTSSLVPNVLTETLHRAFTVSFGSICMGSLLVNYFHGLRDLVTFAHEGKWKCLFIVVSCLLDCVRDFIVYMNKWSFVYVGLYGYSFFEGGKNVTILFRGKGWKKLVTDDLADNILFIMTLVVACLTGFMGIVFSDGLHHYKLLTAIGFSSPHATGFLIGFSVGFIVSSIYLSVVGGTVNAVIVCFAESAVELQSNHPRISEKLRSGWALELPNK